MQFTKLLQSFVGSCTMFYSSRRVRDQMMEDTVLQMLQDRQHQTPMRTLVSAGGCREHPAWTCTA